MRKQIGDLGKTQLGQAARQVNTFVFAPRAARTNSALQLSQSLSKAVDVVQDYQKKQSDLNVDQATQNKLHGQTLFVDTMPEATAEYESIKDQFDTVDAAAQWYLDRTTPEEGFQDPHQAAGFREAQAKALGKFRGSHAEYLFERRDAARTRDVLNDFFLTTKTDGADTAFTRLRQIADNYGMSKDDIDQVPLGAAEILISQGRFEEARNILENKRGGAGTLLDRPNTAITANKLLSKIETEDTITIANQIKELEDTTKRGQQFTPAQKIILDNLLEEKQLTITQRNNLLEKNDEAVRVDGFADKLAGNLSTPGRTFFDPIEGATADEASKARKVFTKKFYEDAEDKRVSGKIDPVSYAKRIVSFSEQTNTSSPSVKARLGAGFSAFNPQRVLNSGEIDAQTLSSVGEYITLYNENPQVASAHLANDKTRDFFDALTMDVLYGGFAGDTGQKIEQALRNYSQDTVNPLQGSSNIRVSDDEIITAFTTKTDEEAGFSFFNTTQTGAAENAMQWVPYIKAQVKAAARRTGNQNKSDLIEHVVERVVKRNQRIGSYLVPMGTNTYVGNADSIKKISDAAVEQYVTANPEDGFEADDLVLTPVIGQTNKWGITVKGSNHILEVIDHNELPLRGNQPKPDKQSAVNPANTGTEKDLLDFIAAPESNGSYNVIFGGEERDLTGMTVQQVLDLQETMKSSGDASTAVGRYQFINKTLKGLIEENNIPKDRLFDESLQDELGQKLLERRGLKSFKKGSLSTDKFIENLAKEWAALPKDKSGKSYYDGDGLNKSLVSYQDLRSQIEKLQSV